MMKKLFSIILIIFIIFPLFGFSEVENSEEKVEIHFFEDARCPDCARAKRFIKEVILEEYQNIEVFYYEISSTRNQELLKEMMADRGVEDFRITVPTTFIGDNYFQGFYSEDKELIKRAIEGENVMGQKRGSTLMLPIIGEVHIEDWSLPVLAIIIGSLDGLNVCSIGALILILMIVLSFNSRKKTIFYGSLFIFTAVTIYGVLVFAWTALFNALASFIGPLNIVIGIAALIGAFYFFSEFIRFYKHGPTCGSSTNKLAAKATKKLTEAFKNPSSQTIALVASVITFAAIITLVELPCSFGLPMVYGGILAGAGLSWTGYLGYILLYLLFYMLIELIIFAGAVITKEVWIAESNLITWVYLVGALVLFFLSYYYLIGF